MFYVHGGGYNQGSGNDYKGQSLVNHSVELKSPVIIVTINYRLSFFGFSGKYFPCKSTMEADITSWQRRNCQ
jgi:carboxylesterase type B